MVTEYTVTGASVIAGRQVENDAAAGEIGELGGDASGRKLGEGGAVERRLVGQVSLARTELVGVVARRELKAEPHAIPFRRGDVQGVEAQLPSGARRQVE